MMAGLHGFYLHFRAHKEKCVWVRVSMPHTCVTNTGGAKKSGAHALALAHTHSHLRTRTRAHTHTHFSAPLSFSRSAFPQGCVKLEIPDPIQEQLAIPS